MESEQQGRLSNGDGNAVVSAVRLWAARDGIHLRIDTAGTGADAAVTDGAGSAKDDRILFGDLRRVLMANGCWESGDEGSDAQAIKRAGD